MMNKTTISDTFSDINVNDPIQWFDLLVFHVEYLKSKISEHVTLNGVSTSDDTLFELNKRLSTVEGIIVKDIPSLLKAKTGA